jgi:hypothetical protein
LFCCVSKLIVFLLANETSLAWCLGAEGAPLFPDTGRELCFEDENVALNGASLLAFDFLLVYVTFAMTMHYDCCILLK